MKNEDILSQLRDIHLPDVADVGASSGFAMWPFIVFGIVVLVIVTVRLWNRNEWRRNAKREFAGIMQIDDPDHRWSRLLRFASDLPDRAGRRITLPRVTFQRPEVLDDTKRSELVDFLTAELRR